MRSSSTEHLGSLFSLVVYVQAFSQLRIGPSARFFPVPSIQFVFCAVSSFVLYVPTSCRLPQPRHLAPTHLLRLCSSPTLLPLSFPWYTGGDRREYPLILVNNFGTKGPEEIDIVCFLSYFPYLISDENFTVCMHLSFLPWQHPR